MSFDPFASAVTLRRALAEDTISARELLYAYQERIARLNPELNAIVTSNPEAAADAEAADRSAARNQRGVFGGLPITIKDTIDVRGLPTTAGLRRRAGTCPDADAPLVARARLAGAVLLGKTNTPPNAGDWQTDNALFGRTLNPWNPTRTPGGSTGGGAAAVAAGLSPLEFGSDIGGSIRVPAAFCGIYGHRPSDTLVPRSGHFPGSPRPNPGLILNVLGPLARHPDDLEMALEAVAGPEPGEDGWRINLPPARHQHLADYRVAMLPEIPWLPTRPDITAGMKRTAEALHAAGATVTEAQPEILADLRDHHCLYTALLGAVFSWGEGKSDERRRAEADELRATGGDFNLARAEALLAPAALYLTWLSERERYRAAWRSFFMQWDVLVAPIAPVPPFPHFTGGYAGRMLVVGGAAIPYPLMSVFPGIATLSGLPATAFPTGLGTEGVPIGLQAIGPYLEDRTPLRFTALLAEEIGGFVPPPAFANR